MVVSSAFCFIFLSLLIGHALAPAPSSKLSLSPVARSGRTCIPFTSISKSLGCLAYFLGKLEILSCYASFSFLILWNVYLVLDWLYFSFYFQFHIFLLCFNKGETVHKSMKLLCLSPKFRDKLCSTFGPNSWTNFNYQFYLLVFYSGKCVDNICSSIESINCIAWFFFFFCCSTCFTLLDG